jgi:hypothetical protein
MSSSSQERTDRVEDLPDQYLRCRTFGHAWEEIPTTLADPAYMQLWRWYMTARCTSCATERYEGIANDGSIGQRSYKYPDRYSLSFTLKRADARLEYLGRTRVDENVRQLAGRR